MSVPLGNSDVVGSASPGDGAARTGGLSFRAKLVMGVCALVVATGAATTWFSHRTAQATSRDLGESIFREVSSHAVTHSRAHVLAAEPVVETMRNLAAGTLALGDTDRLANQLVGVLKANPTLSWVYYADEAGAFTGAYRLPDGANGGVRINQSRIVDGKSRMVEHDVLADGTWKEFLRNDDSGYDPRRRPYYVKAAASSGKSVWLEPYLFYLDKVPGVSCAAPVRDASGKLLGVIAVDFALRALSEFVSSLSVSEHSRVFLYMPSQALLAHPNLSKLTAGKVSADALPTLADAGDPLVDAFRANVSTNASDAFRMFNFRHGDHNYLASATTFGVDGDQVWVVGAIAPESDFLAGVWKSQAIALATAGAAVLLGVLLAMAMARAVSRPIAALIGFTRKVGAGQLDAKADFSGGREFRELSGALNQMIDDLRDRLRLRHSLNLAMEVQQRLLPGGPPRVRGLDVAGHSTYCDETGGDYYDFLIIDPAAEKSGQLLIALGDVMGHGIAAALVMAGARAVLRDRAGTTGSLGELMSRLNALLASDLDGTRFMTMHLALVDAEAKTYRFASAGHDPAIIYDPATDEFIEIDEGDLPLGVMEGTDYQEHSHGPLRAGQVILVGTDGIWEMPCASGEQFGKDRLRDAIRGSAVGSAAEVVAAVLQAVHAFRGECQPVDDVTFVVIKHLGIASGPESADAHPAGTMAVGSG